MNTITDPNADKPMPPVTEELDTRPQAEIDAANGNDQTTLAEYFKMLLSKGFIPASGVLEIANSIRKLKSPLNYTKAQRHAIEHTAQYCANDMLRLLEVAPYGMLEVTNALSEGNGEAAVEAWKKYLVNCEETARAIKEIHANSQPVTPTSIVGA